MCLIFGSAIQFAVLLNRAEQKKETREEHLGPGRGHEAKLAVGVLPLEPQDVARQVVLPAGGGGFIYQIIRFTNSNWNVELFEVNDFEKRPDERLSV